MGEMAPRREVAVSFHLWLPDGDGPPPADTTIAIGTMAGSWWFDWERINRYAKVPLDGARPEAVAVILLSRLFTAVGDKVEQVTRERADEIALEYGEKRVTLDREDWLKEAEDALDALSALTPKRDVAALPIGRDAP